MNRQLERLLRAASRPYRRAGIYPWQFARWKLRLDPVFLALLRSGCLPDGGLLVDAGCGHGVLLALLAAAREQYRGGEWPPGWPAPPSGLGLQGLERRADRVRVAQRALGDSARIAQCDVREADLPRCSAIAAFDLLLYLRPDEQERLLGKMAAALEPGGVLLLREADAAAGFAYRVTRWSAQVGTMGLNGPWPSLYCRSAREWAGALERLGFSVRVEPMSAGTPFANVLFVARKASSSKLQASGGL